MLERDQAGVEANVAVMVVDGAEARQSGAAEGGSVGQAEDLQPPVGPDVGQAVVTVVQAGEHVEVERGLVWVEQLAEVN